MLSDFPALRDKVRPLDPAPAYLELFAEHRLPQVTLPVGTQAHLVGRYADLRATLLAPVSSRGEHANFPMARKGSASNAKALSFLRMDGAEHRAHRRLVTADFTVARIERLRPLVRDIVRDRLAAMRAQSGPVDLVSQLAQPIPSLVICHILGVPAQWQDRFQSLSQILVNGVAQGPDKWFDAISQLRTMMEDVARIRRDDPAEDLISTLAQAFAVDDQLEPDQLAAIALLLLVAGHETTASMMALGTLALLENRDQLEMLRADPSLAGNATEELLRFITVPQWIPRVALEDFTVGGVQIRAGDGIVLLPPVANRDAEVFTDPAALDIRRGNADRHLGFGFGPHQCVGLQLARMELCVLWETMLPSLPALRLAVPVSSLEFSERATMYGVKELPVTW